MKVKINTLFNIPGSKKPRKRVGRGIGSGTGKTCGRGVKGQKSRSGVSIKTEGGQMPLIKRFPKRGFHSLTPVDYTVISLADLEVLISDQRLNPAEVITKAELVKAGYIKSEKVLVKLLGGIEKLSHKLTISLDAYSASGRAVVEQSGGKFV